MDRWWDLQSGLQHGLLTLETNVLWPTNKAAEVSLGLDILPNAEIPRKSTWLKRLSIEQRE